MSSAVCSLNSASDPPNRLTTQSSQQELDFAFLPPPQVLSLFPLPHCPSSCLLSPLPNPAQSFLHFCSQRGLSSRLNWMACLAGTHGFPCCLLITSKSLSLLLLILISPGSREGPALAPCAPPSFPTLLPAPSS